MASGTFIAPKRHQVITNAISVTRVSKLRRKSVSGGLQTWQILMNSGPDALETPLSSLKLG